MAFSLWKISEHSWEQGVQTVFKPKRFFNVFPKILGWWFWKYLVIFSAIIKSRISYFLALKILLKDWFYLWKNIHQINLIFGKDKIMERYGRFSIKIWKGEFSSFSSPCNTGIQEGLKFVLIHKPCLIKGRIFPHSFSMTSHGFHTKILKGFYTVFLGI